MNLDKKLKRDRLDQLIKKLKSQGIKIDWAVRISVPREG